MLKPSKTGRRSRLPRFLGLVAVALAVGHLLFLAMAVERPVAPKTRTDNVKEEMHGVEISDPYRWLEDSGSPETRAWIDAQNSYTDSVLGQLPNRELIRRRLTQLLNVESVSIPEERHGRLFFTRRMPDQDLPAICVMKGLSAPIEVLLDPNSLFKDHGSSLSLLDVSEDGNLLAYGVRRGGEDETTINLLNVDTRLTLPDSLPRARYHGVSLRPDKSGFYYSRHTAEGPRVYFHRLGNAVSPDTEIFGKEFGPDKIVTASLSEDGAYLLITVHHGAADSKTEIYFQDLKLQGQLTAVVNDLPARFHGEIGGGQLFLLTDWQASRGKIVAVDLKNPSRANWKEIVPSGKDTIEDFSLAAGRLFVNYLDHAVPQVEIFSTAGKRLGDLNVDALGTVSKINGNWSSNNVFFSFTSFHFPTMVVRYEVNAGKQYVWHQPRVPLDNSQFVVRQVWYESKDKTRIPMFLMHGHEIRLDGSNPTLLTGYGGFNLTMTPAFSASAVVWVENGGVYALPNLRGGGEFGEDWHRAGMLEKKQNVFDDFIAAAEWLGKKGYAKPSRLGIAGGSNGGLLVGAALTQRPELFQAAICRFPLLDMLRYQRFLVARYWTPEYGSAEDPGQFKFLRAYSPYHQVKAGTKYPAVLLVSGDADTRVDPLHARKMAALLQASTGSDNPVLLRYDAEGGHASGSRPVSRTIRDASDELLFLIWQLGERFQ